MHSRMAFIVDNNLISTSICKNSYKYGIFGPFLNRFLWNLTESDFAIVINLHHGFPSRDVRVPTGREDEERAPHELWRVDTGEEIEERGPWSDHGIVLCPVVPLAHHGENVPQDLFIVTHQLLQQLDLFHHVDDVCFGLFVENGDFAVKWAIMTRRKSYKNDH